MTLQDRFWAKVDASGDCWEWTGATASGYGEISVDGRPRSAHRVSWEFANGSIQDDLWVLHHCDNRICVRPSHLFLGTVLDNNRDMFAKGRNLSTGRSRHVRASHCVNGHRFDESNTRMRLRVRIGHPDSLHRECLSCERDRNHRAYLRRSAVA